jgi:hypothetical protein
MGTEPPESAAIKAYVRRISGSGAAGLHILITHDSTRPLEVGGAVIAAGVRDASLRYPPDLGHIEIEPNLVRFALTMPEAADPTKPSVQWMRAAKESKSFVHILQLFGDTLRTEQDHAEIVVALPIDAMVGVRLEIDGMPISPEMTYAGARGDHRPLDGTSMELRELIAIPIAYDPAGLPRRTAAYLWYVPPPESVSDENLDPSLRESLRALGYLGN